jgi:hypothetical protein
MTTPCLNHSLSSIVDLYKKFDALKSKRGLIEDLKAVVFVSHKTDMMEAIQKSEG